MNFAEKITFSCLFCFISNKCLSKKYVLGNVFILLKRITPLYEGFHRAD